MDVIHLPPMSSAEKMVLILICVLLLGVDTMTTASLMKENIYLGLDYKFQSLLYYYHDG